MSPGRAEAHAEDARSALTRRSARSYLRPDIAPSYRACAVDSRESTSVPSHLSSAAPLLSAEPTGLKPTHTCFRRAEYRPVRQGTVGRRFPVSIFVRRIYAVPWLAGVIVSQPWTGTV